MKLRTLIIVVALFAALTAWAVWSRQRATLKVASKQFTESVILGEVIRQRASAAGVDCDHRHQLGGTRVLFNALLGGDIDIYPEYTGTITHELLPDMKGTSVERLRAALANRGVAMTDPLGFNNTYAIGVLRSTAEKYDLTSVSDLRDHPRLRFGFTNEFMDRGDGWPSLRRHYSLDNVDVRGLDHDIAYQALATGGIDVTDLYATDAKILKYDLMVLDDDLKHFPVYDAVILYRAEVGERFPRVVSALSRLAGKIPAEKMIELNAAVELDGRTESSVAGSFLTDELGVDSDVDRESLADEIVRLTREHLFLVCTSMFAAILIALPLGIVAAKSAKLGQPILGLVGIIQTIPALALLVLLMKPLTLVGLPGIEAPPAIVALFLYSLLPIVRNTCVGIQSIPRHLTESAEALGLPAGAKLRLIELPLAMRTILAGIKTAAVINVGFATLGALIGAGGYGQPILTGIRLQNYGLIMRGAIPAAALALLVQGGFELVDRWIVPASLRQGAEHQPPAAGA